MYSPIHPASLMFTAMAGVSQGFVLVAFDMETMASNADAAINQSATASTVHSSLTVGTLDSRHNGSSSSADFGTPNAYESSQWNTFSHRGLDQTPYWDFTVTPEIGETIALSSLTFDAFARMNLAGGTAEVDYVLRWSGDAFAGTLATIAGPQANATDKEVIVTGLSADLSSLPHQTTAFTFRLEVLNNGGTNGVRSQRGGGIDNLTLSAIPEPASALFGSLGLLAMLRRRRC